MKEKEREKEKRDLDIVDVAMHREQHREDFTPGRNETRW